MNLNASVLECLFFIDIIKELTFRGWVPSPLWKSGSVQCVSPFGHPKPLDTTEYLVQEFFFQGRQTTGVGEEYFLFPLGKAAICLSFISFNPKDVKDKLRKNSGNFNCSSVILASVIFSSISHAQEINFLPLVPDLSSQKEDRIPNQYLEVSESLEDTCFHFLWRGRNISYGIQSFCKKVPYGEIETSYTVALHC